MQSWNILSLLLLFFFLSFCYYFFLFYFISSALDGARLSCNTFLKCIFYITNENVYLFHSYTLIIHYIRWHSSMWGLCTRTTWDCSGMLFNPSASHTHSYFLHLKTDISDYECIVDVYVYKSHVTMNNCPINQFLVFFYTLFTIYTIR